MEDDKDWEARFQRPRSFWSSIREACTAEAAVIAAVYWGVVLIVSFAVRTSGADMVGTLPMVALTVPWSLLAMAAATAVPHQDQLQHSVPLLGTLIVFPIFGALNAVVIAMTWSAIQRRRNRKR